MKNLLCILLLFSLSIQLKSQVAGDTNKQGVLELEETKKSENEELIPIPLKEERIYKVIDQMPRFPGCEELSTTTEIKECADREMFYFIARNILYPMQAIKNKTEGTVVIGFVVEIDGSISEAKIVREIGDGCGAQGLRVINQMNEQGIIWTPGMQAGEKVRVQYNLPVKFKLDQGALKNAVNSPKENRRKKRN